MDKRPRGASHTPASGPAPFERRRLGVLFECPSGAAVSTEGMHCPHWDPPMGGGGGAVHCHISIGAQMCG